MMEGKKKFGDEINKVFDYTMFSYRMSFEFSFQVIQLMLFQSKVGLYLQPKNISNH